MQLRRFTPRWRGLFAAMILAGAATGAFALEGRVAWRCTQEADAAFNVACFVEGPDGAPLAVLDPLLEDPAPPARSARGRDLRAVAHRAADEVYAFEVWRVPLLAPPIDPDRVTDLLRAALCGRHPDCSVRYSDGAALADARVLRRR